MSSQIRPLKLEDYPEVRTFATGGEDWRPLGFLHLVYERDGDILGYAGAQVVDGTFVMTGMAFRPKPSPFVVKRLAEVMDEALWRTGLAGYAVSIPADRAEWCDRVRSVGAFTEHGENDGSIWFYRDFRRPVHTLNGAAHG